MTSRTAPTLRWLVDTATYEDVKTNWVKADRELRALLAVARAARKHRPSPEDEARRRCSVCEALARLALTRAPRGSGKRRGRA